MNHFEEIDFIVPRNEMIHNRSMSYLLLLNLTIKLDNIWLATIAGRIFQVTRSICISFSYLEIKIIK